MPRPQPVRRGPEQLPVFQFALIFCALFLLHATVLRLPYFWDEAGYFIPAARDLLLTGSLIPHSTLSNAHPPLVMAWLALWWKLSAYTASNTRVAMLLLSAFGMLGIFRLARHVSTGAVAFATVALTALYPVIFAQSSLAQLDMAAMAFTIWAIYYYVSDRLALSVVFSALACLSKETAIVTPLALLAWELFGCATRRWRPALFARWAVWPRASTLRALAQLAALVPLAGWFIYLQDRTGHLFGSAEFTRYNLGATLSPLRIALALVERLWHLFGYMNLFVLTAAVLLTMHLPPVCDAGNERPPLARQVRAVFVLIMAAYVVELSVLGGALLARYMVVVIPLVILMAVAELRRRLRAWPLWVALCALAFVVALTTNPPWRIAPEDNLAYTDFVRVHKAAASYLEAHYPEQRILTAWPASDELNRPFLGYVAHPLTVVRIENFTSREVLKAQQQLESFDVVMAFSTKYGPPRTLLWHWPRWRRVQERYFDFHEDLPPQTIAAMLHGRIAWQKAQGGEWVAIIEIDKIHEARLQGLRVSEVTR